MNGITFAKWPHVCCWCSQVITSSVSCKLSELSCEPFLVLHAEIKRAATFRWCFSCFWCFIKLAAFFFLCDRLNKMKYPKFSIIEITFLQDLSARGRRVLPNDSLNGLWVYLRSLFLALFSDRGAAEAVCASGPLNGSSQLMKINKFFGKLHAELENSLHHNWRFFCGIFRVLAEIALRLVLINHSWQRSIVAALLHMTTWHETLLQVFMLRTSCCQIFHVFHTFWGSRHDPN